jgi:hypothetical protein
MQSLEGESFMDLITASAKEEGGQHVQGWENIALFEEEAALENKLKLSPFYFIFIYCKCLPMKA